MSDEKKAPESALPHMPDAETIRQELAKAKNINDLTGKDGVFARLFGKPSTPNPFSLREKGSRPTQWF